MQRPTAAHHRIYLLAYDLGDQDLYDRARTAFLVRAGVLTELARRGHVADRDGHVRIVATEPDGDPALDEAMGQIADHDRGWQSWLRHDHKQTLRTVERDLQATQVLQVHERKRLGLIATTHVTVADAALVDVLQQEARAILHGSQPVEEVEPVDAAVVALCAAGRVPAVVSRGDRHDYDDRIDALTDRVAAIAPGLRDAFRGIRTTMIAAQGGMGGG